jgi:hypothetical protein
MGQVCHLASQAAPTGIPEEGVDKGEVHVISQQCPSVQTSGGSIKKIKASFFLNMLLLFTKVQSTYFLIIYFTCVWSLLFCYKIYNFYSLMVA